MEIIIENGGLNGISNYQPLLAWAQERTATYRGLVVQESGIAGAKADAAELRRIAKAASDYRIQIKKEHEKQIETTINQLKELTDLFTSAADGISNQVKAFDEREKAEKKAQIEAYYAEIADDLDAVLPIERLWNPKWLNKGEALDDIKQFLSTTLENVRKGIAMIRDMQVKYEQEMISTYLATLDMGAALARKNELEQQEKRLAAMQQEGVQRRAEREAVVETPPPQPEPEPVPQEKKTELMYRLSFEVEGTQIQILGLRQYLVDNRIKFRKID